MLRPYQQESINAINREWSIGRNKTLLVLPTGTGKTVVFSEIAKQTSDRNERTMVLAHRGELLEQAQDKIKLFTGLDSALEKADSYALESNELVTVASMQTLLNEKRLDQFPSDYFKTIIVDEAHHVMSEGYQKILTHFVGANVLGCSATPDRSDHKNLGQYFDSLAYEYTLPQAIKDGWLVKLKAMTIPLKIDINNVKVSQGDFQVSDIGHALEPYLEQIADEMVSICKDKHTVVFLPLIETSKKFCHLLNVRGLKAAEVNGQSPDRNEILNNFANGEYQVLCNSMLLTEGWDCPITDCIVILRPTKVRSLYCLDEETEILTNDGFKKWNELEDNVLVGSFNKETEEIQYKPLKGYVHRKLNEDEYFCSYEGIANSIRVTNKHRILYDNKRKTGWKFKTADEICDLSSGIYVPVSGYRKTKGLPLSDDEIKFLGWFVTDGSLNKYNNAIAISQAEHQPWINDLEQCIKNCGMKYGKRIHWRKTQFNQTSRNVQFTISYGEPRKTDKDKKGWKYLEKYIDKNIADSLFEMNDKQFDIFIETVHLGDGSKQLNQSWKRRSYHITKGNKTFINRLQILALEHGYKANVIESINNNGNPLYTLHLKKKTFSNIGSKYDTRQTFIKEKHTNEYCWCVETEDGTIITRRNGKVTIMGNCQMIGRGTRLHEGKEDCLILDFLWQTQRHDLCRPAVLIAKEDAVSKKITEKLENGEEQDLIELEEISIRDVLQERENKLAEELRKQRNKKRGLVDPLQYAYSIMDEDLTSYEPTFGFETKPITEKQLKVLENFGINADAVKTLGHASMLIDKVMLRNKQGLSTAKQIRKLESYGFQHVGNWSKEQASKMMARIAANHWMLPHGINPYDYRP